MGWRRVLLMQRYNLFRNLQNFGIADKFSGVVAGDAY
jgi:hypothetical protein